MPNSFTKIKLKRAHKIYPSDTGIQSNEPLVFGEPAFVQSSMHTGDNNDILAIGNTSTFNEATFFEGHNNSELLGKGVYHATDANGGTYIVNKKNVAIAAQKINPKAFTASSTDSSKYPLIAWKQTTANGNNIDGDTYVYDQVYLSGNGVLMGAAWNDYAEFRECISGASGDVVCEQGDGTLGISKERLQPLPYVISDTAGIIIGLDTNSTKPVAVSGRALVKVNCDVAVGDVLCADKDGFATVMTREEIQIYPDRILGIVSEIPRYKTWHGNVIVHDRVWITIK